MKNRIFLFIMVLLTLTLSACDFVKKDGVAVTVYSKDILVADIEKEVKNSNLVYEQNIEYINNLDIDNEMKTKLLDKIDKPKTYNEILNKKIEYFVLLHEADKRKITSDFKKCKDEATKIFVDLSSVTEDDYENYKTFLTIKNYMESNDLSDEEYIEILANQYYDNARINLLKDYFKKNLYDVDSKISYDQQYAKYVERLINEAKIVYYS